MGHVAKYREQAITLQGKLKLEDHALYPLMEIIKALINYQGDEQQATEWLRTGKWRRWRI